MGSATGTLNGPAETGVAPAAAGGEGWSLEKLLEVVRCPDCREGRLAPRADGDLRCARCSREYPVVEGVPFLFPSEDLDGWLEEDRRRSRAADPMAAYSKGGAYHWGEYGIEELLPAAETARRVLLLGAGDSGERPYLRRLGFDPVAFDIHRSPGTDFLADAHRLPLADGAFDLVLSMQVLEHLHSPWTAVEEVGRVLRPGGWFIGSVAFLKAFHQSYFHMTHEGVALLLERAGLAPERFEGAQSLTYSLYGGLLPLGPLAFRRWLLGAIDRAVAVLRVRAWSLTRREDPDRPTDRFGTPVPMSFRTFDRLRSAPAVVFRARKGEEDPVAA